MKCLNPFYLDRKLLPERSEISDRLGMKPRIAVRCGKCMPCRIYKRRLWTLRIMHEASKYNDNAFITLTFNDENLPDSICLGHLQKFFKRFRRFLDYNYGRKIRYFACGEYGDKTGRPHYHAIIFNWFPVKEDIYVSSKKNGKPVFSSIILSKEWPYGNNNVGTVTSASASYVASYVEKKIIHKKGSFTLDGTLGPFAIYSKGIGDCSLYNLEKKYFLFNGKKFPVPRYYKIKNGYEPLAFHELYDKLEPDDTNYHQLKVDFNSRFKLFHKDKEL